MVIRPPCTAVADSRWRGVRPAQLVSCVGPRKPAHIADLGDGDRAQGQAHAGDGLHRGVARVVPLALEAGAQPDELRPVPDEFAKFPAG